MILYLKKENDLLKRVDSEKFEDNLTEINVQSIEEFDNWVFENNINKENIDEEIEETIQNLLSDNTNKSLNQFNIKHWVSNRSFGELIDMYDNKEIKKPDMQREFVWDSLKCSRLIESIIMGLPIPPLFLLEVENNQYELIDGFQRITTIFNYVKGLPWYYDGIEKKKVIKSKLSKQVAIEIGGKSFDDLNPEYQRIIRRSTIPLIEFKQLEPDNYNAKYMIFERINTGSEKLNSMQIRKALANGKFITDLYVYANSNNKFRELFSKNNIKKDAHVEAILRVIVMSKIYYGTFSPKSSGINDILNEYCEQNRNKIIDKVFIEKFDKSMKNLNEIFDNNEIFRRVEIVKNTETDIEGRKYFGNINIAILESVLGVFISNIDKININIDARRIKEKYEATVSKIYKEAIEYKSNNPFNTSTGSVESIKRRFNIIEGIIGK